MRRTELRRKTPLVSATGLSSSRRLTGGRPRKQSDKRAEQNRIRASVVAEIVAERGPRCEVPWCSRPYRDAHEVLTRARGGSITDPANIRLVCRQHHNEIGDEAPWAYELGFLRHSWDREASWN